MKDNKFFELFDDIDIKFIHEAEDKIYDENAETITPQLVSASAQKRKIYPAVLKTAACFAAVAVAAGVFISIGKGTPGNMMSPNSEGQQIPEVSDTADTSGTLEPSDNVSDTLAPPDETFDPTLNKYEEQENNDCEADRKLAVEEWNSREFASPIGELPLPAGYSASVDWEGAAFKSFLIPVEVSNAEIRAVSDGEVVYIGYIDTRNSLSTGGNVVLIKHNDYVYTNYCGLEEMEGLKVGDKVTAGQVIGYVDENTCYYLLDSDTDIGTDQDILLNQSEEQDIRCKQGFTFELRTAPVNETDIGKIMGTVIGGSTLEDLGSDSVLNIFYEGKDFTVNIISENHNIKEAIKIADLVEEEIKA